MNVESEGSGSKGKDADQRAKRTGESIWSSEQDLLYLFLLGTFGRPPSTFADTVMV